MKNGVVIGVISVFIAIVVIGSVLVPVIDSSTTTTTVIDNEGAVGLRMDKVTSGDFTLTYGLVGDDFTATNGTDAQVIDDVCIFYADDNVAVWMDDSSVRMLGKDANDQTIDAALSDEATITITKSADGVNVTDGTVDQTFPVPAWSYVPKSTGAYGFFLNDTEINTGGLDVHYVGSFAGVNCYNSINTYDLPITLDAAITGSTLTGAKWIKAAAADPEIEITPLEPGSLTPLDPGVISLDPEPDASIMSVPTPTYTEGDWGYDVVNGEAVIVSYSGSGGDIVVPETIGGYTVKQFGKSMDQNDHYTVFDNSALSDNSSLKLSSSIERMGAYVLEGSYKINNNLIIPQSVSQIGRGAFFSCGISGIIVIPGGLSTIPYDAFRQCANITGVVIPSSITTIQGSAFNNDSGIVNVVLDVDTLTTSTTSFAGVENTYILNLGEFDVTTINLGQKATEIKDNVPALGYLAPAQYNETVTDNGAVAALLNAIPLIVIISVVMLAIGLFIVRRTE